MIVTKQQMIQCEQESGKSEDELMELAGRQCAYAIMEKINPNDQILILCGKGNNGGDGFVIARVLMQNHFDVHVYLAENNITSDTARMMADLLAPSAFVDEEILNLIDQSDVIIDCIYGFSFHVPVSSELEALFDAVNQSSARTFSIDINSGLEADTGKKDPHAIQSEITFVLGHYKIAHLLRKDHQCFEKTLLLDLSLPNPPRSTLFELNESRFRKYFPAKAIDSYKGINGRTLCIAGSPGTMGAALLSTQAAWKTGIGYLHLLSESSVLNTAVQAFPVLVTHQPHDFSSLLDQIDSVMIGCGCDHLEHFDALLQQVLEDCSVPVVLDAYALRSVSEKMELLDAARAPLILTPHLGEFSALTHLSISAINKDKLTLAKQFAIDHGVTLVLKGPHTIVASSDGRLYINQTGHQNLAKAGSGDVLAGLIAGLSAQISDPFLASSLAVWLHGKASDLSPVSDPVFSALDLLEALNLVYQSIV